MLAQVFRPVDGRVFSHGPVIAEGGHDLIETVTLD
jgi:hypothetical protein